MTIIPYEPTARVIAGNGRQDHIDLALGRWVVAVPHVAHFMDALANYRFGPADRVLFNRPSGGQMPSRLVVSAGGRGRHEPVGAPLFSGVLKRQLQDRRGGIERVALTLNATINPTRFIMHQPSRRFALSPRETWVLPPPAMYRRAVSRRVGDEAILDDNDNVLLGEAAQRFAHPDVWERQFQRYWAGVVEQVSTAIGWAAHTAPAMVEDFLPSVTLRTVETYWEFGSADPTALVAELEPVLFQLGMDPVARTFPFPNGQLERGLCHNARQVTVRLSAGVRLKVYAKTTRRVRFEIEHDLKEGRTLIAGGRRSGDLSALWRWLDHLRGVAAVDLNRALDAIEHRSIHPANSAPTYALLREIVRATDDEVMADALLSLIVHQGVIRIASRDPLRTPVQRLVAAGVLAKVRGHCSIAPTYRRAASELRVVRRTISRQRQ